MPIPSAVEALDPELNALCLAERLGGPFALTVERFAQYVGIVEPTRALQQVVSRLAISDADGGPVSVTSLCRVIGVALEGLKPTNRGRTVYSYSAGGPTARHRGHLGSVKIGSTGQPVITIPDDVDGNRARVSVAHELTHVLLHRRAWGFDDLTIRLPSSPAEEALAEYGARLLLLRAPTVRTEQNLALECVRVATGARVTIHAAAARIGDPDQKRFWLRGAILWRLNPRVAPTAPPYQRLTPQWHLCPGAFVPIGHGGAREDSLVARVAAASGPAADRTVEDVRIGTLSGQFVIDAFSWGSVRAGTRLVLSFFGLEHAAAVP